MTDIPHHLADQLLQLKSDQDIQDVLSDQQECLNIYEESQKKLEAFNKFSQIRYQHVHKHFEAHTKLLAEVKNDLNSVFSKIRKIKSQLASEYPNEMEAALKKHSPPVIEDD
ncbi:hypothetical protein EDC96DRAFT_568160 [Choanephora cucurbitarum]|nr:hypothetical protein EDC96DRAFT_568160 [Choanephora cucurbitarum]